jgi:peptidyl-prolyl cis-trans isomerase C
MKCLLPILVIWTILNFTSAFVTSPSFVAKNDVGTRTELHMGFMDGVGDFMKRFTLKADASHILMKGNDAASKLQELKAQIGDDPVKFAEAAATYSSCPSGRKGGNLGEFGPGQMVKEFDTVVFKEEVGVVHGPIKTQFGQHLILINQRND